MELKRTVTSGFLFYFVSVCLLISQVCCQTSDNTTTTTTTDGALGPRPIDEGMEPLYQMTKTFLNLVQPESKGNILNIIDVQSLLKNEGTTEVLEDYDTWAKHYIGYAACVAFGLLFIVFMPLIGMCICCCRCCCGNCGGKTDPNDPPNANCKRITIAVVVAILNVFMLVAMVCAFVTTTLIKEQTNMDSERSIIPELARNMKTLQTFKESTFNEIRTDIVDDVEREITALLISLEAAPVEAKKQLGKVTDSEDVLNAASDLAESAERINASLTIVNEKSAVLQGQQATLSGELTAVKDSLTVNLNALSPCDADCETIKDNVANIENEANFNNVQQEMQTVQTQLEAVKDVVDSNLVQLVNEGKAEFEKVTEKVTNDTRDQIAAGIRQAMGEIRTETDNILRDVRSNIDTMEQSVDDIVSFKNLTDELNKSAPLVSDYGMFLYYAGMGLSCLLLLITLFYLLGLLFGVFGEPPYEGSPTCNKGVGANFIMAGIGFTFLFGWLLMFVCLITFLIGGIPHTEFCRLPIVPTEDSVYSKGQMFDAVLGGFMGGDNKISVSEILQDCQQNKGLLQVGAVKDAVKLDELLDLEKFGVKARIDELSNVTVNLTDVDILSVDLENQLRALSDAGLDDINFDSFQTELNKSITTGDLQTLADTVRMFANGLPDGVDQNNLIADAAQLDLIFTDTVSAMENASNELSTALSSLETDVKGGDRSKSFKEYTEGVIAALQAAEDNVHINGTKIIQDFVTGLANETYQNFEDYVKGLTTTLSTQVGQCQPVATVVEATIDIFCVNVLSPFNGFWFSLGWFLFFATLAMCFGFKLVTLYRKSEDYDRYHDNKSFDDPRRQHQPSGRGRQQAGGQHNTGYDTYPQPDYPQQGGYGGQNGGGGGYYPPTAPPQNPPHYYNNRHY